MYRTAVLFILLCLAAIPAMADPPSVFPISAGFAKAILTIILILEAILVLGVSAMINGLLMAVARRRARFWAVYLGGLIAAFGAFAIAHSFIDESIPFAPGIIALAACTMAGSATGFLLSMRKQAGKI